VGSSVSIATRLWQFPRTCTIETTAVTASRYLLHVVGITCADNLMFRFLYSGSRSLTKEMEMFTMDKLLIVAHPVVMDSVSCLISLVTQI
jgi:hypothetical protein